MEKVGVYILVILFVNLLVSQANSIQKSFQSSHNGNSAYRTKHDKSQSKAAETSLLQLSMESLRELGIFETVARINRPSIEKTIKQKSISGSQVNTKTDVLYSPVRDDHAPSCEKGQNFKKRFPGSCRKYYECNNGILTTSSCYWFRNFDMISQSCKFYYFVDCSITEPPTTTSATITTSIFETTSSVIFTENTTISNHTTSATTNVSTSSSSTPIKTSTASTSSLEPTFEVTSAPPLTSKSTTQMSTSHSTTASSFSSTNSTGFTSSSSSSSSITSTADTSASTSTSVFPKSTSTSFPSTTSASTASPPTSSTNTPIATTHGVTSSSSSTQTAFSPESTSANVSSTQSLTTKPPLSTTTSTLPTSTPTTVTVTAPTTQYPDLPRCSPGQYYKKRYPNDCHRFYFCRNGILEIWICNAFYNFDAITLTCKVFWEVDCTIGM